MALDYYGELLVINFNAGKEILSAFNRTVKVNGYELLFSTGYLKLNLLWK